MLFKFVRKYSVNILLILLIIFTINKLLYYSKIREDISEQVSNYMSSSQIPIELNQVQFNIKIIRHSRADYLPLMLYSESLYEVFKKLGYNVEILDNFNQINDFKNALVILYFFEYEDNVQNYLEENNIKTIVINTEFYEHFGFNQKIERINEKKIDCTIFEYSVVNYKIIKEKYPHVKVLYTPLLYHQRLENIIPKDNKKDIDVLIFGAISPRRGSLIEKIDKKYNVMFFTHGVSNDDLLKYIGRSKIVLNAHNHEYNFVFDYYRNSFLIANNVFFIYEYPYDIDYSIEKNLNDMQENLIVVNYDNINDTIEYYLNNLELINSQLSKQKEWFKRFTLEDNIIQIFSNLA
jgi:hypothetical protein